VHLLIWVLTVNGILFATLQATRRVNPAQEAAQRDLEVALLETRAKAGDEEAQARLKRIEAGTDVEIPEAYMLYGIFSGLFVAIGVIIVLQGSVVGERSSGTAQWVLSGPVSRVSFILAKLVANTLGFLVVAVAVPGALAFVEMRFIAGIPVAPGRMALAASVILLHDWFYLTLTLMTSTIFRHWAPAIGVPFAVLGLQNILMSVVPGLVRYLPWVLAIADNNGNSVVVMILAGMQPISWSPVVTTGALCVAFVVVALAVFRREEL
jgi:ABC-type Na+ efflux pump permease subunit